MMMNRNSAKDSLIGIGPRNLHSNGIHNVPRSGLLSHRRVMSFTSTTEDFNSNSNSNNVDLFSHNRRPLSVAPSDESDLQVRLRRLSAGSTKPAKSELDDLISSNEGGKHDYDWLLTPPETPLLPSSDGKECQPKPVALRRNSSVRSGSTIQNSRLSASQSESIHPSNSKPARSSSATRSSAISTAQYTTRNPNILNTSSASVSSYTNNRSSSAARPSTPRSSTPSRTRPPTTTATATRPSTPTSPAVRPSASRPSTPTRRSTPTPSGIRVLSPNGPTSRPSSPGPRARPPPQPIIPPDFPHETPPNLRTSLPERPLSAGRSRPGPGMTVKGHVAETTNSRRQSSPIATRGRQNGNGQLESLTKKPIKTSNSDNGTGFGRNISKKSLDMAIKLMDIRSGGIRSALFPQSIRSGNPRLGSSGPGSKNGILNNGNSFSCKVMEVDIYESSRYDAILMKEDLKNTSWLHTAEERSDEGPLFDNGFESFEPLPEPFAPL